MFTHRQIKRDSSLVDEKQPDGRKAKEKMGQMRDHQEMLTHYMDMLCGLGDAGKLAYSDQLKQASKCLRKIQIELS